MKVLGPDLVCSCLLLVLLCNPEVVFGQFEVQPVNLTVLRGGEARFNATVQRSWIFMTWDVGGIYAVTIQPSGNFTTASPRYTARLCGSGTSCAELTIYNVTRSDAGPIDCSVQGESDKTVQLYVQESGSVSISGGGRTVQQDERVEFQCEAVGWFPAATVSWTLNGYGVNSSLVNTTDVAGGDSYNSTSVYSFQAVRNTTVTCLASVPTLQTPVSYSVQLVVVPKPTDWTVLIAVVLSFSLFGLLVLLIIGIVFCYKRRKEKQPTYQAEMMRQRTQSQLSSRPQRQGQDNPVFTVDASLPPSQRDSGFFQTNGAAFERPESGLGYIPAFTSLQLDFPKHRHATIV